jgi:hypothetical protein
MFVLNRGIGMKIHSPLQSLIDPIKAVRIKTSIMEVSPIDEWESRAHQLALSLLEAGHFEAAEVELAAIMERRHQPPPTEV